MFLNIRLLFCCFLIHDYQHILSSIYLVFYALIKELFLPHYINFSFNIYKSNNTAKKKLFIKFLLGKDGLTEDNFCFCLIERFSWILKFTLKKSESFTVQLFDGWVWCKDRSCFASKFGENYEFMIMLIQANLKSLSVAHPNFAIFD